MLLFTRNIFNGDSMIQCRVFLQGVGEALDRCIVGRWQKGEGGRGPCDRAPRPLEIRGGEPCAANECRPWLKKSSSIQYNGAAVSQIYICVLCILYVCVCMYCVLSSSSAIENTLQLLLEGLKGTA